MIEQYSFQGSPEQLMDLAIRKATVSPFGAVLYNGEEVIVAENTGSSEGKVHHAELNTLLHIPEGFKKQQPLQLFTTCEPCPMCMGAAIWVGVEKLYFGITISEAAAYTSQIRINSARMNEASFYQMNIIPHFMKDRCRELFNDYF